MCIEEWKCEIRRPGIGTGEQERRGQAEDLSSANDIH